MRKTAKIFTGILLVVIFLSGALVLLLTFGNPSFDSTSITNAGFAIFAGCASVCFSWARNFEEKSISNKIRLCGERFFFTSLCFVVASLFKFIYLNRIHLINTSVLNHLNLVFPVLNIFSGIIFLAAYISAWTAIIEVISLLLRKVFD